MFSPSKRRYRQNSLIVDQTERVREALDIRGPHSRASVPPPGAGTRRVPIAHEPVNHVAPVGLGALLRRTGLFVVAYAPLAALVLAARWPAGWSNAELLRSGAWVAAMAVLAACPIAAAFAPAGRPRLALAFVTLLAGGAVALGAGQDWTAPPVAGVAFGFCVAAAELVALMVVTLGQPSTTSWRIRDPGEPGGLVVDYAGTYVFPLWLLLITQTDTAWVGPAVTLYLLVVFAVFVGSQKFVLVSPVLRLLGFRLYDVVLQEKGAPRRVVLISRRALAHHGHVKAVRLGPDCFVGRRATAPYAP